MPSRSKIPWSQIFIKTFESSYFEDVLQKFRETKDMIRNWIFSFFFYLQKFREIKNALHISEFLSISKIFRASESQRFDEIVAKFVREECDNCVEKWTIYSLRKKYLVKSTTALKIAILTKAGFEVWFLWIFELCKGWKLQKNENWECSNCRKWHLLNL